MALGLHLYGKKEKEMEEDYGFYADNFTFDETVNHECEDCGKSDASLYNAFGQALSIGGFNNDLMLCDACHKIRFKEQEVKCSDS